MRVVGQWVVAALGAAWTLWCAWQMVRDMATDHDLLYATLLVVGVSVLFGLALAWKSSRDWAARHPRWCYGIGGGAIAVASVWLWHIANPPPQAPVPSGFVIYGFFALAMAGLMTALTPLLLRGEKA